MNFSIIITTNKYQNQISLKTKPNVSKRLYKCLKYLFPENTIVAHLELVTVAFCYFTDLLPIVRGGKGKI